MTLNHLRALATLTTNPIGQRVVQIPLEAWQEYLAANDLDPEPLSQAQRILLLLEEWKQHPEDSCQPAMDAAYKSGLSYRRC